MLQRALEESRANAGGMRRPRDRGKPSKKCPRGRPRKRAEPEAGTVAPRSTPSKRARSRIEVGLTPHTVAHDAWVACDACHAWRRLPEGVAPPHEEEEWDCSRGFIVAGGHGPMYHARCAVAEEGWDEEDEGWDEQVGQFHELAAAAATALGRDDPDDDDNHGEVYARASHRRKAKRKSAARRRGGTSLDEPGLWAARSLLAASSDFIPGHYSVAAAAADDDGRPWDDGAVCQLMGCTSQLLVCFGHREVGCSLGCAEREHVLCRPCLEAWFEAQRQLRTAHNKPALTRRCCPICQSELSAASGDIRERADEFWLGLRKLQATW